ncbi:hypothetical protein ACLOJK_026179 [Asimina triloba]
MARGVLMQADQFTAEPPPTVDPANIIIFRGNYGNRRHEHTVFARADSEATECFVENVPPEKVATTFKGSMDAEWLRKAYDIPDKCKLDELKPWKQDRHRKAVSNKLEMEAVIVEMSKQEGEGWIRKGGYWQRGCGDASFSLDTPTIPIAIVGGEGHGSRSGGGVSELTRNYPLYISSWRVFMNSRVEDPYVCLQILKGSILRIVMGVRQKENMEQMWNRLIRGVVDTVASAHLMENHIREVNKNIVQLIEENRKKMKLIDAVNDKAKKAKEDLEETRQKCKQAVKRCRHATRQVVRIRLWPMLEGQANCARIGEYGEAEEDFKDEGTEESETKELATLSNIVIISLGTRSTVVGVEGLLLEACVAVAEEGLGSASGVAVDSVGVTPAIRNLKPVAKKMSLPDR